MDKVLTIDMPNGDVVRYPGPLIDEFMAQQDMTLYQVIQLLKKEYMDSNPNQGELI